jgi:hypothetical protein
VARFDADRWTARSWARCQAAQASGAVDANTRWYRESRAIEDLVHLVAWCGERGLEVDFAKRSMGVYHLDDKKITISCRLSPERQVAILLHECGHHLVGREEQHDRFGMGYPQTEPEVTKTFHHRVACLEEEMEAWHRGWKLACRLGLKCDRALFDEVRLQCIRSYVKWTLRPKTYVEV